MASPRRRDRRAESVASRGVVHKKTTEVGHLKAYAPLVVELSDTIPQVVIDELAAEEAIRAEHPDPAPAPSRGARGAARAGRQRSDSDRAKRGGRPPGRRAGRGAAHSEHGRARA